MIWQRAIAKRKIHSKKQLARIGPQCIFYLRSPLVEILFPAPVAGREIKK